MRLKGMRSDLVGPAHAVALLAMAALVAATSVARAAPPVIACVDPKATMVLTDSDTLARHDEAWRVSVEKRGRCYRIQPTDRWEPVFSAGGLVIMRRTPPQPGIPPLYFRPLYARADGPQPESVPGSLTPVLSPGSQGIHPAPVGEVRMETLPPLPSLAPAPIPAISVHTVAPDPAPPEPAPSAVLPELAAPAPAPPPADTPAQDRGYALGFGIAIIVIVLLLAGLALLLRVLLRPPPEIALAPARPSQPGPPLIRLPLLVQAGPEPPAVPEAGPAEADGLETEPVARDGPAFVYAEAPMPMPMPMPILPGLVASYAEAPAPAEPGSEQGLSSHAAPEAAEQDLATLTAEVPRPAPFHAACAALLSQAGWDANVARSSGSHHADVVARRGGRILALRCLSDMMPVDEDAVEEACMARERERADLGVIVSNGSYSTAARKLAAQTGIDLLREDELPDFVGQARPVT